MRYIRGWRGRGYKVFSTSLPYHISTDKYLLVDALTKGSTPISTYMIMIIFASIDDIVFSLVY